MSLNPQSLALAQALSHLSPDDRSAIIHWVEFQAGFLGRISHELRSPLSSLMSLQQLILNDLCDSPEEERDCVQQSYQAAQRLLDMLDLSIRVSKIRAGLNPLKLETISLQMFLGELEQFMGLQAAHHNLKLRVFYPDDDLEWQGDPNVLRQAIVCLLEASIAEVKQGGLYLWVQPIFSHDRCTNLTFYFTDDRPLDPHPLPCDLLVLEPNSLNPETLGQDLQADTLATLTQNPYQFSPRQSRLLSQILLQRLGSDLTLTSLTPGSEDLPHNPLPTWALQWQLFLEP